MAKRIAAVLKRIFGQRANILLIIFLGMSAILVARIFDLQIIRGQSYADNFEIVTTRTRTIRSSRGNIYDAKGRPLAWNELANSVILEDNGSYANMREKNLALNGEILALTRLITGKGDTLMHDFHIIVDENGKYAFDLEEGRSLDRFRADVFGCPLIENMTAEQSSAGPDEIMDYLCSGEKFGLDDPERAYTEEELEENGLNVTMTAEDRLNIIVFRYQLSLVSYQRYLPVTVAKDVSDATVAAVEERSNELQGVSIAEDYTRRYVDSDAMGAILGYTGLPSAEDLETLRELDPQYSSTSVIGKSGIEQYFETTLQGTDGQENVTVNNVGKVLAIDEASRVSPRQGDDIYLSIDLELQEAVYKILEQRIAGILVSNIEFIKESKIDEDNDKVAVAIYSVYNSLIENNLISLDHLFSDEASEAEKRIRSQIESRTEELKVWLADQLNTDSPRPYKYLPKEERIYISYIASNYLENSKGIISSRLVDHNDETYRAFHEEGRISLQEYLLYAINNNWVSLSELGVEESYLDSLEIFQAILRYVQDNIPDDEGFVKRMCKYLILDDRITADDLVQALYDQGFFGRADTDYAAFKLGTITAGDLLVEKISKLEITPAQLALDPCAGSAVITDPKTGKVQACVSYPGFNSNRLANKMDEAYFTKLNNDESTPFYNKATQQLTAPGSTFKPVMAAAGLSEGVISENTEIYCSGLFGVGLVPEGDRIHCAYRPGHGDLNVVLGLTRSCNVFFCTVGYELGMKDTGSYRERNTLRYIQKYAEEFGLGEKTGIEMPESSPHISTNLGIASSIGQGEHQYTTVQLAKYVSTIAMDGVGYRLTLVDHISDAEGNMLSESEPEVINTVEVDDYVWKNIHQGMRGAVKESAAFGGLKLELCGKTGTAQEDLTRPSHSVFIGHTRNEEAAAAAAQEQGEDGDGQETVQPMEDIALAVRIPFGYSSKNASLLAKDILQYYYNLREEASLITGRADSSGMTRKVEQD